MLLTSTSKLVPRTRGLHILHNSTDTGAVAKIGGGEFCYIPVPHDKTFKAYGTKANQMTSLLSLVWTTDTTLDNG